MGTKIENDTKEVRKVEDKIQTNEEKENDKEKIEKVDDDQSIDSIPEDDMNTRLNPVQVAQAQLDDGSDKPSDESKSSDDPVHPQVASITLNPSPAKLSPATTVKLNRSRSVNTEHPGADPEQAQEQQ